MITTGQILAESTETFIPLTNRLYEIGQEFIQYFIYIAGGMIGISLIRGAVKYILFYLKKKTETAVTDREKPKMEFGKHYVIQNGEVIREETEEERATREEDEERNRQNPYYDPNWG